MQISIKPISDWTICLTASADERLACITQTSFHSTTSFMNPFLLQPWHKIELLPTPFLHTPQGHLPFSTTLSLILQLNITFVFHAFIFKPFASNSDFHFTILSRRLSSLSAIKIKSSAYSNSRGKPARSSQEIIFHYYHKQ